MIASQKIGKGFMGAFNYNLKKMNHSDADKRAKLLDTNFSSLDNQLIKREIDLIRELRPNLNRYVYHTSLNFSKEEKLSDELLMTIAHRYLELNGFNNNQYFIFRHYDAEHPHLHLLVNRITFDGKVVSDSNNFKRSEQILRNIERQYSLIQVSQSKSIPLRAATKDELEMVIRTGKPSDKILLQEKISLILKQQHLNMQDFIQQCEAKGINLLFNQQSTGRISGITFYHEGLIIRGQKLGNRFKWSEIIKRVNYEQSRDCKAISQANSRTTAKYGTGTIFKEQRNVGQGSNGLYSGGAADLTIEHQQPRKADDFGNEAFQHRERSLETDSDADSLYRDTTNTMYRDTSYLNIQIADDVDNEAVYGRNRHRKKTSR